MKRAKPNFYTKIFILTSSKGFISRVEEATRLTIIAVGYRIKDTSLMQVFDSRIALDNL